MRVGRGMNGVVKKPYFQTNRPVGECRPCLRRNVNRCTDRTYVTRPLLPRSPECRCTLPNEAKSHRSTAGFERQPSRERPGHNGHLPSPQVAPVSVASMSLASVNLASLNVASVNVAPPPSGVELR